MKDKKFYVVWKGNNPGIFSSWDDCKKSVTDYQGARFKSFNNEWLAKFAYEVGPNKNIWELMPKEVYKEISTHIELPVLQSISVDAACSGNPGVMEYRGVFTQTGTGYFAEGPFDEATVNLGEFLAIVHALALMHKNKLQLPVYSDSITAMKWVREKKVNTKLRQTPNNQKVFEYVTRALAWLRNHEYKNNIMKWDTTNWGEIPADFGRK